jgi:Golgi nucleoside diphosphatase
MLSSIFVCFVVLLLCTWFCLVDCRVEDYAIVIDAGSTGSRGFVFHITIDLDDSRTVTSTPCGRVFPGLSSFVTQPEKTVDIMLPLFINAAQMIPVRYHEKTQVFIKGTAGMRLLTIDEQEAIWKGLVDSLNRHEDNPFHLTMNSVGTIDGHAEAYYAVLASNYIAGSIDGNLQ